MKPLTCKKCWKEYKSNYCDKLLDYRVKSSLCFKHSKVQLKILFKKYGNHKDVSKEYRRRHWHNQTQYERRYK